MKNTKKRVLKSLCTLLVCFSMFVGSTFAWFTDTVTSGNNIITSGNLDVELYWTDALNGAETVWTNVEKSDTGIFVSDNWEPGRTEVKYLKVVNNGDLSLKYQLSLLPMGEIGKLADVIDVYYAQLEKGTTVSPFVNRLDVYANMLKSDLVLTDMANNNMSFNEGVLLPKNSTDDSFYVGETIVAIALHMQETAGNEYQNETVGDGFGIQVLATQYGYESDSFGKDYDSEVTFPTNYLPVSVSKDVTQITDGLNELTEQVEVNGPYGVKVTLDAGTKLDGTGLVTLKIQEKPNSDANVHVKDNEALKAFDVHVEGLADDNTKPMVVEVGKVLPTGLNKGNLTIYHLEKDTIKLMKEVSSVEDFSEHNQFVYEPADGSLTLYMASFSEVATIVDTTGAWEGNFDYTWYDANKTELTIANADQLAAFGSIVGGMAENFKPGEGDSFIGKTIKLVSDINLGDSEEKNTSFIFYPIGYYNNIKSYEKESNISVTSNVSSFSGIFDGNGHKISNFYQNTWEMFGDYNSGYSGIPNHYKDAMGLFGYVNGGTVKNLTVDHFSSDGEYTPTGVIAAYAAGNAIFENIAITNCNPRVYNTGNGGIIGIAGSTTTANDDHITLKNITVDNSNKISALWGSWDVACGGLVGMYRGNVDGSGNATRDTISFENCHVAAQIDVYNDVCANYQYYAYRYAGMMIGSVRHNTTNDEGKTIPNMTGVSASGCTVNYGDWNDYYYCEFEKNSLASYSKDYQFSRIPHSELNFTDSNGNGVVDANERASVTGCKHEHTEAEENNMAVYLPFHQLFTGYSWGVSSIGLEQYGGIVTDLGITEGDQKESVVKFETKFTGDFLYRVGNKNEITLDSIFKATETLKDIYGNDILDKNNQPIKTEINSSGVYVTIEKIDTESNVSFTYEQNTSNWTKGKISFTGTGTVKVSIQDYNFCLPTTIYLEVVDAINKYEENISSVSTNTVLLSNVTSNSTISISNSVVYGNGFEINVINGDHSAGTNTNYSIIGLRDSTLDNVQVTGPVYNTYGIMANSDYSAAVIGSTGNSKITNSYVSNGLSPIKALSGTLTIENTTLHGGRFCNLDVRGSHVILDGVTTINTSAGGTMKPEEGVLGLGIVVYYQNSDNAGITIGNKGITQHNWIYIDGDNKQSGDYEYFNTTGVSSAFSMMFDINSKYTVGGKTFVNTGIVSLNTSVDEGKITVPNNYKKESVSYSGYDGYLWTPDSYNSNTLIYDEYKSNKQGNFEPEFKWNHSSDYEVEKNHIKISFNNGENYVFDTKKPTAKKSGKVLDITVKKDGEKCSDTIIFEESGEYTLTYEYYDPFVYSKNGEKVPGNTYTQTLYVTVSKIDTKIAPPTFTFTPQENGVTYTGMAGTKNGDINGNIKTVEKDGQLWIMPNVNSADVTKFGSNSNGNNGKIGVINGIYFPIIDGGITYDSGSAISKGSIYRHYPFYGLGDASGAISITDNGVTYDSANPSTSLHFYSEYDGTQGIGVGSADDFGLAQGSTSTGVKCNTHKWGIVSGGISGGDSTTGDYANNVNSIYYAKFSYTASNEQTYYYYVGFAFNQEKAAAKQEGCFTADTLITLADGTQKRVDQLSYNDKILTWDFFTNSYIAKNPSILVNHGLNEYDVIYTKYSDGTTLKVIAEHGLFDYDLNKFVYITAENVKEYIGHRFVKQNIKGKYDIVTMIDGYICTEYTEAWSITSQHNSNAFASGLLTVAPPKDFYNWVEMDGKLQYDIKQLQEDISKYGLYTYDDFKDYVSYEQFVDWNGAYLKIPVSKGNFTFEYILELIELYKNWMPN